MLVSETKEYASEAAHFYWPDGRSCHQLPYKDKKRKGELRNTTLRDARELGLYPSVSAILGVVEKKGLDGWKKEQVAKAAVESNEFEWNSNTPPDHAVEIILKEAESNMTKARDLGTEIHGAIERYLGDVRVKQEHPESILVPGMWFEDGEKPYSPYLPHIKAAVAALRELGVWGQPFSAERTFASPLGYGGTVDFRVLCESNGFCVTRNGLVADFKCVDRLDKKLAYDDRCAQLCAYAMGSPQIPEGVTPNPKYFLSDRLVNIFISTSEPGKYLIHEWSTEEKEHGWALFKACFELYKIVNRYDPLSVTSS